MVISLRTYGLIMLLMLLGLGCVGQPELAAEPRTADYGEKALAGYYASENEYITKESYISIKVTDGSLESRYGEMTDLLESEGADISNVDFKEYDFRKQYTVTAKVEPKKFDDINEDLKQLGEVKDMSVELEDVTAQYQELEVRIDSRELELERLYELYNLSEDVEDLLEVEREISRVETELELLKQQEQRLISRVERSTIRIMLYEDKPSAEQLIVPLEGLGGIFFGALAAAITILVALAGFLLPLGIAGGLLWFSYQKMKGKGKKLKRRRSEHDRIPPPQ
ncbi:DUF4349 domain-containing protein [Candidatus Micrarchaeota archaeon]|nr:DUF4349 domain-containing protein [Candidatus Micrarchaeota archaeon]